MLPGSHIFLNTGNLHLPDNGRRALGWASGNKSGEL